MLIRYPGSKEKIARQIVKVLLRDESLEHLLEKRATLWDDGVSWEYREPFFGAGAVGFRLLGRLPLNCSIWLNDIDYGIVCLWKSARDVPKELCERIEAFTPHVDHYYAFKESDGSRDMDVVTTGFRKLALHQMSFSGLGAVSGGPLGGKEQSKKGYPVDCRWSAANLIAAVWRLHDILKAFRKLRITCKDFAECFTENGRQTLLYCDPPYYAKGPSLYKHSMTDADHERLAQECRSTQHRWAVSYDAAPEILALYAGFPHVPIDHVYTVAEARGVRRKNHEILILDGK